MRDQPVRELADAAIPFRNADRDRDRDVLARADGGILAADLEHAAGDQRALAHGGGRQHDAELVAAGAGEHVAGPQSRLRHQGEVLEAGIARGVAMGVVDGLEAVEIDHQQRERLAAALRAGAFLGQPLQQMAAVGDAGEIVEQREVGDLVAQAVHRHQQEAEIERHRQEQQPEHHDGMGLTARYRREIAAEQIADRAHHEDRDDGEDHDAGQPGTRTDAAFRRRQQQTQRQRQRQAWPSV